MAVGATLDLSPDGKVEKARVALAGCAPTPIRAKAVESALHGQTLSPQLIDQVANEVLGEIAPLDDVWASADYKKDMAVVWVKRALRELADA